MANFREPRFSGLGSRCEKVELSFQLSAESWHGKVSDKVESSVAGAPLEDKWNGLHLLDFLRGATGDVTINFNSGGSFPADFHCGPNYRCLIAPLKGRNEPARAVQAEPPGEAYMGDFIPELKPGDEVTIGMNGSEEIAIRRVDRVTARAIWVGTWDFDREGRRKDGLWQILRRPSDADYAAEWWRKANREADKRGEDARYAAATEKVKTLLFRIPNVRTSKWELSSRDNTISLAVTLDIEELAKVVAVLEPKPEPLRISESPLFKDVMKN